MAKRQEEFLLMYRNSSIWDDIKMQFRGGNIITVLIIINIAVFIFVNLVHVALMFVDMGDQKGYFQEFVSWIGMPMNARELIFRPWTVITYMFVHVGLWHILWNMLYLFWFGRILREFVGDRKILPIYFYGGLIGAAISFLVYQFVPALQFFDPAQVMIGASAGIMGIVVASATIVPDYQLHLLFLGAVRLKYIALVVVILDIIAIPYFNNTGGHLAHLGGALFGYIFIKQLQNGHDWSRGFNKVMDNLVSLFQRTSGPKVHYRNPKASRVSGTNGAKSKYKIDKERQDRLDHILDKIARSGYNSLSAEEKEFLFKVSKEE